MVCKFPSAQNVKGRAVGRTQKNDSKVGLCITEDRGVVGRPALQPSVADWGGGMSASCKPRSSCSLMRAMDGRIVHCGVISSCQSAATSEIVKRFWSRG